MFPPTGRGKVVPKLTRRRLLQGLGATATAAFAAEFLPPNVRQALAPGPSSGGSLRDIKHVVILMQENRSFDHYFGALPNVRGFSDPSAVKLSTGKSVFYQPDTANPDGYLLPYHLNPLTTSAQAQPSTSHAWAVQHSAWNNGAMNNWLPAHLVQYYVIADDLATKAQTKIEVGAYPQDVAVSPTGKVVYATVTAGDTGPGGSDVVAAIDPATNKVTADIRVGPAPRQVVFSHDGSTAYVTTETGIYEISTATSRVVRVIPEAGATNGPQGIALSPNGATLYVTNPDAGTVAAIDAASGKVVASASGLAEPYSVTVTPNGSTLYVADMNSDSVSVISTATNSVVATLAQGAGTSNLDAALTDIAFAPALPDHSHPLPDQQPAGRRPPGTAARRARGRLLR
jgi:YVTN family beta-propeller protein